NLAKKSLLLDIGSGNGFPAVPLGIMLGIPTILCEPNAKKAAFLQNLKAYLNLENFIIKKQKVESLRLEKAPDLITSRATFSTEILLNKCKHLITKNSMLLLFKGQNVKNEIPANLAYSCYETSSFNYLVILGENIC
ncbi:MAG: RsmG family class I SAM-dependent methyltransferase, partial [Helicobacter sp.]|nr:RsmG family class I SAM-dependent methyltransferase [Helicobacter sp.]